MNNRRSLHLLAEAYKQVVESAYSNEGLSWQLADYYYGQVADPEFEKDYTFSVWGKELCDKLVRDHKLNFLKGAQIKRDGEANATITITCGPRTERYVKQTFEILNDIEKETERTSPFDGVIIATNKPDNADSVKRQFDAEAKANIAAWAAARAANNRQY